MPRPQESPTDRDVFEAMNPCEPYTPAELATAFEDADRWKIRRRFEKLHEDLGVINRKEHAQNRISWWRLPGVEFPGE